MSATMSSPPAPAPADSVIQAPAGSVNQGRRRLRLLSYNIQVGINSTRPHHYLTKSWKHLLPHARRFDTLDRIAQVLKAFDVVALQEVDAGSLRSGFVNLTEYLAQGADFPFWHHQLNRDLGKFAQHSNGLLSRIRPSRVVEHKLPGLIPGRGALEARYGRSDEPLVVMLIHLALGRRARLRQLAFVSEIVNTYPHVVLMGDMNCQPDSPEMKLLLNRTELRAHCPAMSTFPSWRPNRHIDHILVTPGLEVAKCHVIPHALSDHLPIAMEVSLPGGVELLA